MDNEQPGKNSADSRQPCGKAANFAETCEFLLSLKDVILPVETAAAKPGGFHSMLKLTEGTVSTALIYTDVRRIQGPFLRESPLPLIEDILEAGICRRIVFNPVTDGSVLKTASAVLERREWSLLVGCLQRKGAGPSGEKEALEHFNVGQVHAAHHCISGEKQPGLLLPSILIHARLYGEVGAALEKLPDSAETLRLNAALCRKTGDTTRARVLAARAAQSGSPGAEIETGWLEIESGNFSAADRHFRKALSAPAEKQEASLGLGIVLREMGFKNTDKTILDQAVSFLSGTAGMPGPCRAQAWFYLGTVYSRLSMWQEAADACGKSLKLRFSQAAASNLAMALIHSGKVDEAEAFCRRLCLLDPESASRIISRLPGEAGKTTGIMHNLPGVKETEAAPSAGEKPEKPAELPGPGVRQSTEPQYTLSEIREKFRAAGGTPLLPETASGPAANPQHAFPGLPSVPAVSDALPGLPCAPAVSGGVVPPEADRRTRNSVKGADALPGINGEKLPEEAPVRRLPEATFEAVAKPCGERPDPGGKAVTPSPQKRMIEPESFMKVTEEVQSTPVSDKNDFKSRAFAMASALGEELGREIRFDSTGLMELEKKLRVTFIRTRPAPDQALELVLNCASFLCCYLEQRRKGRLHILPDYDAWAWHMTFGNSSLETYPVERCWQFLRPGVMPEPNWLTSYMDYVEKSLTEAEKPGITGAEALKKNLCSSPQRLLDAETGHRRMLLILSDLKELRELTYDRQGISSLESAIKTSFSADIPPSGDGWRILRCYGHFTAETLARNLGAVWFNTDGADGLWSMKLPWGLFVFPIGKIYRLAFHAGGPEDAVPAKQASSLPVGSGSLTGWYDILAEEKRKNLPPQ
ncbi:MAG: hypothetical protein ABIG11_05210 [bacterium]